MEAGQDNFTTDSVSLETTSTLWLLFSGTQIEVWFFQQPSLEYCIIDKHNTITKTLIFGATHSLSLTRRRGIFAYYNYSGLGPRLTVNYFTGLIWDIYKSCSVNALELLGLADCGAFSFGWNSGLQLGDVVRRNDGRWIMVSAKRVHSCYHKNKIMKGAWHSCSCSFMLWWWNESIVQPLLIFPMTSIGLSSCPIRDLIEISRFCLNRKVDWFPI